MKNVKVILISVAMVATIFANARIDALGGDAGFWPGDRENATAFPGTLNDANWIEYDDVNGATPNASINWGDDVKWGFNFDTSADNNNWMNMSWAKDGMGLRVGFVSASDADGNGFDDDGNAISKDASGFDLGWGSTMSFGEIGVGYKSMDSGATGSEAQTSLTVNWRGDCNVWLFDNAKASFAMNDGLTYAAAEWDPVPVNTGTGYSSMHLGYDLFTHLTPADGVTALVSMGFGYWSWDLDYTELNDAYEVVAMSADGSSMWLPKANLAVEAAMTDWATVRAFVSQDHTFSCDLAGSDCDTGNTTNYGFGLGFGWQAANGGSVNLDMVVDNSVFTDPIQSMTGFESLGSGKVTISYLF